MATVLLVGCGKIGTGLGLQLSRAGHRCFGLKRHLNQLPEAIQGIAADVTDPVSLEGLPQHHYLVFSLVPAAYSAEGYQQAYVEGLRNLLQALREQQLCPKRIFFVSSAAVYHQRDGSWVDESSPTEPTGFNGQAMLDAEQLLADSEFIGTSVRFSGIYGAGRERILNWVRQGVTALPEPCQYGNRIHQQDCIGVLRFLIEQDQAGQSLAPIYLASDPNPAPYHEVLDWLRQRLAVEVAPQPEDFSQKLRSGSKRCSSKQLQALGYQFQYPDYRAGFEAMIAAAD
ncbi:SDR family oxidoreductase [Motiliproteus coralliicola]|uniref:SDR family oxidoreductase n=1 Tax=Motiliproteus coralliicola TaxID=2283196 RepID=UPI001FB3965C|nr:SDR family oxidoreductase [Motiliproteus coralliicola]